MRNEKEEGKIRKKKGERREPDERKRRKEGGKEAKKHAHTLQGF